MRTVRNQKNIAPKVELELDVIGQNNYEAYNSVIIKMANLKAIEVVTEKRGDARVHGRNRQLRSTSGRLD